MLFLLDPLKNGQTLRKILLVAPETPLKAPSASSLENTPKHFKAF